MTNIRFIALKILEKIEQDNAYSNITLDKVLKNYDVSVRDSAFICNLVYGVIERKLQLDYIISSYSKIPIRKVSTDVLTALRMGIYQVLFMDKVPDSAAVNESVNLVKKCKKKSATGFVNAILRNVLRNRNSLPMPNKEKDRLKYLEVKYSCPAELILFWEEAYGLEFTEELLKSLQEKPNLIIRVNTLKNSRQELEKILNSEGVKTEIVEEMENALILKGSGSISNLKSFSEGRFHVQDLASQVLCEILSPKESEIVADMCSAPGGKSFTLAQIMNNIGGIYAFDLYDHKVKLINDGAKRLGINIIDARVRDALSDDSNLEMADKVLCDVPCSGLGIIRRKPEIRYKDLQVLENLPNLQYNILCNSERFTKVGGVLMYSTCTLNPKENGEIATRFLDEHKNYVPYDIQGIKLKRTIDEPNNQLTLMPNINNTDGFFIAAFKKIG